MTKLSVIIPAYVKEYQNLESVLLCLNTLQIFHSRTIETEFIVMDDASPLLALPMLVPQCAARVMRNEQNLGFSGNVNAGAALATGDILFIVNQDVFATEAGRGWDTAIVKAFDDPTVGIAGSKLTFPDGKLQSAGGLFDLRCTPFHRWLGYEKHMLPEYSTPETVSWITGAAFAVRADLFRQIGGFDASYIKGYFEDVQACLQVRELGYKVWYQPECTLTHVVGTTGGNAYFEQNAKLFYDRWVATGKIKPDTLVDMRLGWW